MLSNVGLARRFWAEVVNTTCNLINFGPHTGTDCKTPYEVWFGEPADYSLLKVFCCTIYCHLNESKSEPKAKKGIFVGLGDEVNDIKFGRFVRVELYLVGV